MGAPLAAELCRGVRPRLSAASMPAPRLRNFSTILLEQPTARCSTPLPLPSLTSVLAPE